MRPTLLDPALSSNTSVSLRDFLRIYICVVPCPAMESCAFSNFFHDRSGVDSPQARRVVRQEKWDVTVLNFGTFCIGPVRVIVQRK